MHDSLTPAITHALIACKGKSITHKVGGISAPVQSAEAMIECMIANAPTSARRAKLATHKVVANPATDKARNVHTGLTKAIAATVKRGGTVTMLAHDTKGRVVASAALAFED